MKTSGTAMTTTMSVSHAFRRASSMSTTSAVTPLITKKIAPHPTKRRMAEMSLVALDRSWPDSQSSWKPTSSDWSCA